MINLSANGYKIGEYNGSLENAIKFFVGICNKNNFSESEIKVDLKQFELLGFVNIEIAPPKKNKTLKSIIFSKQEDVKNEEEEKNLEHKLGRVLREIAVVDESTINSTYEIITGYPRVYSLRDKKETNYDEYKKVGIYGYNIPEI